MKLVFLCCEHQLGEFQEVCERLNISYQAFGIEEIKTVEKQSEVLAVIKDMSEKEKVGILFSNSGMYKEAENFYQMLPQDQIIIIPIGSDAILLNRATCEPNEIEKINQYLLYGGIANVENCMKYIGNLYFQREYNEIMEPIEIPFQGIYVLENHQIYQSLGEYLEQQTVTYNSYVAVLSHRSSFVKDDLATEKALCEQLHKRGIGTICAYSYGEDKGIGSYGLQEVVENYFSLDGKLIIQGLVNFQMFILKAKEGLSLSEVSIMEFLKLNIPIFHPVNSYSLTNEKWKETLNPFANDMAHSLTNAEMAGMIEPILVGTRENDKHVPIAERIQYLANRIEKYVNLRKKPVEEKRIAIMINNDVCSGVEATIGRAYGLDTFESAVHIMKELQAQGYLIKNIPETGKELFQMIQDKKAISDFRWTSVEDIIASGGVLYRMSTQNEYSKYFENLSEEVKESMEVTWGKAPGEGMVQGDDLIITGLNFGNVVVMVQPKRGCYGAKCTGEICKILHDPLCPPPHQYLATYRYIEHVLKADVVIHTGTDGSLEYLPGKSNGLSESCLPNVVLGSLINIYLYNAGVSNEALIGKRRANAVIVDYLPPSKSGMNETIRNLMELIEEYFTAKELINGQEKQLQERVLDAMKDTAYLQSEAIQIGDNAEKIDQYLMEVRDKIHRFSESAGNQNKHIFGENPKDEECINYILEVWLSDGLIQKEDGMDEYQYSSYVRNIIVELLKGNGHRQYGYLEEDAQTIYDCLQSMEEEMVGLKRALSGEYVAAGDSGMPDENGRKIIPTGRNMFAINIDKIPTKIAYERGKIMAEQLLESYINEEGQYPKKIAMNMISTDVTRTKGEQLCQVLYLLGIIPVWDSLSRVVGLSVIPLEELKRPRIDVTVRISGVMRDTWGFAVELMDEAITMVANLDENEEENYVIYHMKQDIYQLNGRENTIRIFGDPPGTYGAGVDLALKASAWKDEKDLARYFISYSSYAYGKGMFGKKSIREFIQNAKHVDVTCDTTCSNRMNTLSCGFGMQVQGGYRLIAKTMGDKIPKQYQNNNELGRAIRTNSLKEQVEEEMEASLFNPFWKEQIQEEGYDGAATVMKRIQNVFEMQCINECIEDKQLDQLVQEYVNDEKMREWLKEHNPYAAEEIARRMLELESRGKWNADQDTLALLQLHYLSMEGDMESGMSGLGEIQGGTVEILDDSMVETWNEKMKEIDKICQMY